MSGWLDRKTKMQVILIGEIWLLILVFMLVSKASRSQVFSPGNNHLAVYGPGKSLIGVLRGWNPATFYPIDTAYWKYISPFDRELLRDERRLFYYITTVQRVPDWYYSDSTIRIYISQSGNFLNTGIKLAGHLPDSVKVESMRDKKLKF